MKEKAKMGDRVDAYIEKFSDIISGAKLFSIWDWEHYRQGILIDQWIERNLCTDEGLNHVLDVAFSAATQITTWYIAPFEDDHTPAAGNTYATPGFTECTAYDEANRVTWQEAGPSAKVITNTANKASFTFNDTKTIYGGALFGGGTDADTKDDQAGGGTLYCVSQFTSGSKAVVSTDVLKVTIALTIADA